MELTDISLWGIVCMLLLTTGVVFLISVIDRRMMARLFRVSLYFTVSMLLVTLYMWLLWRIDSWWAHLLWVVISAFSVATLMLREAHLRQYRLTLPVGFSVLGGMGIVTVIALLLLPAHSLLLVPAVTGVTAAWMLRAASSGLTTYIHSLRHTQEHYRYLLANGATHSEAIMPSIRRSIRAVLIPLLRAMTLPIVLTPSLLLCGLLMAGVGPLAGVVVTFVLSFAILSASVLTMVAMIFLLNHFLFDRSGRFLL